MSFEFFSDSPEVIHDIEQELQDAAYMKEHFPKRSLTEKLEVCFGVFIALPIILSDTSQEDIELH